MNKIKIQLNKIAQSDAFLTLYGIVTYILVRILMSFATKQEIDNPVLGQSTMTFFMFNIIYPVCIGAFVDMFIAIIFTFILYFSNFFNRFRYYNETREIMTSIWTISVKSLGKMFMIVFIVSFILAIGIIIKGVFMLS